MKEIKKGDIVFCLKDEDKESEFYTEPDFGFVIAIEPANWLEDTEDSITIIRNPMGSHSSKYTSSKDLEPRTYPLTQVLHIEDFMEKFQSMPEDPYKIQNHFWGNDHD